MDGMLRTILLGTVVLCFVGIVMLACYLVVALFKRHSLNQLYDDSARDFRFVCELLRLYTRKDNIIKNPYLLRSYGDVSPRADALVVGGGGVLILTVVDEPGQFSAPATGNWTVWQDGSAKRMSNAFLPGKQYTSVVSSILMKNGLSCPIVNVVVLTDDHAKVDTLHEANVLTSDRLVPYVREFNRRRALGKSGQEKLKRAIRQHHEQCQRKLSTAMAGATADSMAGSVANAFSNTGEFEPVVNERAAESVSNEEIIARKLAAQSIFANEEDETDGAVSGEAETEVEVEVEVEAEAEVSVNETADEVIDEQTTADEAVADEAVAEEAVDEEAVAEEVSDEPMDSVGDLKEADQNVNEEGSVGDILEALLKSLEAERNASDGSDSDQ